MLVVEKKVIGMEDATPMKVVIRCLSGIAAKL